MPIIDPPPCFVTLERSFYINDTVSETRGVYSMVEHRLDFGGEVWNCEVQTHNLSEEEGSTVNAVLDRLRTANYAMRFGFAQNRKTLFGTTTATNLTITGDMNAGASSVPVSGNGLGKLEWGSFVQIGDYLHRNRANMTGDTGTLAIFPRLRHPVGIGEIINLVEPKSVWRLQNRAVDRQLGRWTMGQPLQFVEALNVA